MGIMSEKPNVWIEKFKNPALYMAIIGAFWWMMVQINQIPANTEYIKTIEQRLDKKISIQAKMQDEIDELRHLVKDKEMEYWQLHYEQELKISSNQLLIGSRPLP